MMKKLALTASLISCCAFCILHAESDEALAEEMIQAYEQAKKEANAPVAKPNEASAKKQQCIKSSAAIAAEAAYIAGQEDELLKAKTPSEKQEIVKSISKTAAEAAFVAGQEDDSQDELAQSDE